MALRVGLAQIDSTLGDFSGNKQKILDFARRAESLGCDIVVFPELALFGYMPGDLLERPAVAERQLKELGSLVKAFPKGVVGLVGAVSLSGKKKGKPYYNSAVLIEAGKKPKFFHKELLPTYDVFDDNRFFERGSVPDNFFLFKGRRIQVTICEDMWGWELPDHPSNYLTNPLLQIKSPRPDLVVNLSASPYTTEKERLRKQIVEKTALHFKAPVVYVNMTGGQDELIFDGGSQAVDEKGKLICLAKRFEEDLDVVEIGRKNGRIEKSIEPIEACRRALSLGLRDYVRKTGFERVHLGLSGGIDSAVVACLAVDALGADRVTAVALPGPYSAGESRELALKQANALGIRFLEASIVETYDAALAALKKSFGDFEFGVTQENLQSRLRGVFLMALANKENSMLLSTGNKSEYATGYSTLYGDMCGGIAPIGDLLKHQVYELAKLYNSKSAMIPDAVIARAPSAELRPNQKDQDSLPPYDELDEAVRRLVEKQKTARTDVERWLLGQINKNEFKRWQAPPILKISRHAFGRGRRVPIAHRSKD